MTFAALLATLLSGGAASAASPKGVPYDDGRWSSFDIVAPPVSPPRAPADEYFGRFKLSNLGVRNIIRDIGIEGNSPLALPKQQYRIGAADSAMMDWADKYPRDGWLPRAFLSFAALLQSKQQPAFDQTALDLLLYASNRYAGSRYGTDAVRMLHDYQQMPDFSITEPLDLGSDFNEFIFPLPKEEGGRHH